MTPQDLPQAERFPPGEYVKDELEARGITVPHFATYIGWSVSRAESFLAGKEKLLVSDADKLAKMFGTGIELWLNLERSWRAKS